MNKQSYNCCPPKKRKRKKMSHCKSIGFVMLLFGGITVMAMFCPLKLWVIFLCLVLIIFGVLLIKK